MFTYRQIGRSWSGFSLKFLFVILLAIYGVAHSIPSHAEKWRMISASYRGLTFYPGWVFEDGQYAPSESTFNVSTSLALPSATSSDMTTLTFVNWSAQYPQMTPPAVDLSASTINLSSLVQASWVTTVNPGNFIAWYSYTPSFISPAYNIGPLTPTPFTDNGDGTYTASWITPLALNGYPSSGGEAVSITFARAASVNTEDPGIADTGDVSKTGNDAYIGTNATGTRTVKRNPHSFDNMFLGNVPGISGSLVISGDGASRTDGVITAIQEIDIGNYGAGTVSLQGYPPGKSADQYAGANLTGNSIVLGKHAAATGTLNITEASEVSAQGDNNTVIVGDAGSGTVNYQYGSLLTDNLVLGNQLTGVGGIVVTGGDIVLTGKNPSLSIGREGIGNLSIGYAQSSTNIYQYDPGNIRISSGTPLPDIFIGQYPGSQGTLRVPSRLGYPGPTLQADIIRIGLNENDAPGGVGRFYCPIPPFADLTIRLVKIGPDGDFEQPADADTLTDSTSLTFDLVNQGLFRPTMFTMDGNVTNSGTIEHAQAWWVPRPLTFSKDLTQTASGILKVTELDGVAGYEVLGAANIDGTIAVPGDTLVAGLYPLIEDPNGITVGPNLQVTTSNLPAGYVAETVVTATTISLRVTASVTYTMSLGTAGTGSGAVTGAGTYNSGSTATVTATANTGSTFTGWSGPDGTECASGSVLMDANKSCTATFTLNTYTLSLSTVGTGSGTVSGAGTYNYGTNATVTATANTGSTFAGWSGPDGAACTSGSVSMTAAKSCTATFTLNTYTLSLSTAGTGSGTVSGAGTYNYNTSATVTATANTGSTFAGWSGPDGAACATGSVLMNAVKSCTATFTLNIYTLSLSTAGTGSGTVSGAGTYSYGTNSTVTATANTGSTFTGWSGPDGAACASGSVLMDANKSCTATFTLNTYMLSLSTTGTGSGTVSGAGTYSYGTSATVSATANTGSTFTGWSGPDGAACTSGSVLMDANKSCTATFTLNATADLKLTLTDSPDPVRKGAKLVYTLTVKNSGPSSATNVTLTDILPANIIFVSVTKTQGTCSGTATVICALGTLKKGASATVTISIKPLVTGTITDSATVSSAVGDPNTANNSAATTTLVKK